MEDSEIRNMQLKKVAFWFIGTVVIVFAAITSLFMFVFGDRLPLIDAIASGFPMWGGTAIAAIVIYAIYYVATRPKSE